MPAYALLLAHDERPGPESQWPAQAGGPCEGWAEWYDSTPLLFSVLLGDASHLPERVPCSAYQDKESLISLAAPMDQVKTRWQWLRSCMEPQPAHWPDALKRQWQEIDSLISRSTGQWLLLDCATLCPHDFDEPEYEAFINTLRDRCLQWECTGGRLPESLQSLKQDAQSQWGWWSHSVIARTEMIERDSEDDWPTWLSDGYVERYHGAWDEALDAYYVMPRKHPRTGEALPHENQREHWPVGLVTPYGRWLVDPAEAASGAFTSGDHIAVHYPEASPDAGEKSGLMNLNGIWVVPPSAGYRNAYAVTPQVMACQSPHIPQCEDLLSLPGLELLHKGLSSIDYNGEDDEFIRADKGPYGSSYKLLLRPDGQPLFDASRYEHINEFNAKTGLTVAYVRTPCVDENGSQIREGVIHVSGQEIIPCEFKTIERGFNNAPPKVFPGGKLLAITDQGRPRVYNTKGKLLSAPDIWSPPLNTSPRKNELLCFMGEGPTAEMGMFSLKDFSFTRTGETWDDYRNALQGLFKGLGREAPNIATITRAELIEAEDPVWMQDMVRILCLNDTIEAAELLTQWRACVAEPDPDDMGWDDDDIDLDVMQLNGDENVLTLYWAHLLAIDTRFARFDWKGADSIAATHWLPGTEDWQWDAAADGVETGLEHMAEHLAARQLSLIKLATDDDSIRLVVVGAADAHAFMDRLAQARIGAWDYSAS